VPGSPSLDIADTITIAAWVFRKVDSGSWERMAAKSDSANYDYWLQIRAVDDSIGGGFTDIANTAHHIDNVMGTTTPLNQWTHLAFAYDGTHLQGHVNGRLDKSVNTGSFTIRTSTSPLWVGRLQNSYNFDGLIDEVRVHARALTQGEVAGLAGRTVPFDKPF